MNDVIIKRKLNNIGWSDRLNFWDTITGNKLNLKSYNGCLCIYNSGTKIGYKTFINKSKSCNEKLIETILPF